MADLGLDLLRPGELHKAIPITRPRAGVEVDRVGHDVCEGVRRKFRSSGQVPEKERACISPPADRVAESCHVKKRAS